MPISVRRIVTVTTPTVTTLNDRDRWIWVTPGGTERELTTFVDSADILRGMTGRYSPPVAITRDVIPGLAGARTRDIRHDIREIDIPLIVISDSYPQLHTTLTDMARDMNPLLGAGTLKRIDREGNEFEIDGYMVDGLRLGEGEGTYGPGGQRLSLIFQADDPYWSYQAEPAKWFGSTGGPWFPDDPPVYDGVFPNHLANAGVFGETSITNPGDAIAWPRWTIVGPGTSLTLANQTIGQSIVMTGFSLSAGQSLIIDTAPGVKTVTGPNGANWRQYLSGRSLWGIPIGKSFLTITMGDATSESFISCDYKLRLLAPSLGTDYPR